MEEDGGVLPGLIRLSWEVVRKQLLRGNIDVCNQQSIKMWCQIYCLMVGFSRPTSWNQYFSEFLVLRIVCTYCKVWDMWFYTVVVVQR